MKVAMMIETGRSYPSFRDQNTHKGKKKRAGNFSDQGGDDDEAQRKAAGKIVQAFPGNICVVRQLNIP